MKTGPILLLLTLVFLHGACSSKEEPGFNPGQEPVRLTLIQANSLAELPLACMQTEYPNKLGQTLGSEADLGEPHGLHPAFYGCFDWHSAVHGHWSLVRLLKSFPELEKEEVIRKKLQENLSAGNILAELAYFKGEHSTTFERTYGWGWLLKLAEELHNWNDPLGKKLEVNLQPLTDLIVERYIEFLPKLNYPIRVGEHTNTAFGLCFAWDYANSLENVDLLSAIESRSREFYMADSGCPIDWEPSGYDFLSPCLEEIDLMHRILNEDEFMEWMENFLPQLKSYNFKLEPGVVSDRTDGKLVHLDGLNFSRAWVLYALAAQYPEYSHLAELANEHVKHSLPNLVGDDYEGGHWLGSFAIYALN
ncbi:MAG: DUF2891 domain-containing protein [Bacteroidetes bacterium]|nr:DUF2891 domain-containing protein [Bacteroidota bacterium]